MLILKNVGSLSTNDEIAKYLSQTGLWVKNIYTTPKLFVLTEYKRLIKEFPNQRREIYEAFSGMLREVMKEYMLGNIEDCDLNYYSVVPELDAENVANDIAHKFTAQEQNMIFYCLYQSEAPDSVANLKWSELKQVSLNKNSRTLVNSLPRHIQSGYVFWQNTSAESPSPIFHLERKILEIFDVDWQEFSKQVSRWA